MDLRNLKKFFLNKISVNEIVTEINSEVESFRIARVKGGASCPVHGTHENFEFTIKEKDVTKLCEMYLQGKLNEWHLEYLCNLLELSFSFSMANERVADAVFELSSPEINGAIDRGTVNRIYDRLQAHEGRDRKRRQTLTIKGPEKKAVAAPLKTDKYSA